MSFHKVMIILLVLILIVLNSGHAVASPFVDPLRPRCPTYYPYGIYYIDSSNVSFQQTTEVWVYRYPYCKVLPSGPIMWA